MIKKIIKKAWMYRKSPAPQENQCESKGQQTKKEITCFFNKKSIDCSSSLKVIPWERKVIVLLQREREFLGVGVSRRVSLKWRDFLTRPIGKGQDLASKLLRLGKFPVIKLESFCFRWRSSRSNIPYKDPDQIISQPSSREVFSFSVPLG